VLAYKLRLTGLSGAIGQIMLFRREAYLMIGGHDSVSSSIIDDLLLARRIKAAGLRWRLMNTIDLVSCRMYPGSHAALNGFSKNLFAVFNFQLLLYLFTYLWLAVMFWEPLIILSLSVTGHAPLAQVNELVICIGLSLLVWLIPYMDLGIPFYLASLYPFNIGLVEIAAFESLRLTLGGRLTWKDRTLPKSHWKWF
jgi:chlorobactene glucosyltransferase